MDLFFDLLRSVIYGVIEGITEWLPISSTGPHDPGRAGT